jgi:hypothetical protein
MREDFPDWLGKPPRRGTEAWGLWLEKWRAYARTVLKDSAADDPEFDFGLLSADERQRVAVALEVQRHIEIGRAGGPCPFLPLRGISDLFHASVVAWQVGRSVYSTESDTRTLYVEAWVAKHQKPRRRELAHAIRYGFLAGLGAEAAAPGLTTIDYIGAYEAAWRAGNALAIEADPR